MKQEIIKLQEDTKVSVTTDTLFVVKLPNELSGDYTVTLLFEKPGVSAELLAIYKVKKGTKFGLITVAEHKVPNTSCNTNVKCVLEDDVDSKYIGKIIINKGAQQTSSFLHDSVLVLGHNTRNRSDPILEIEADDVSASHGATTGRIDETQIYYLQTRGLSQNEAQNLIVTGFFDSELSKLDDSVKDQIMPQIA